MVARKKKASTKAVAKKETAGLPTNLNFDKSLMGGQEIDKEDILIPKLWLMQPMSEFVTSGKAQNGEYRDSILGDLLCEDVSELEMILFAPYKTWQVTVQRFDAKKKKHTNPEYVETLNYYDNPDLEYEEEDGKDLIHRDKVLGFYCLLIKDIEKGNPFPYVVDFKRTSRQAGQMLTTTIAKLQAHNFPCYAKTFNLKSKGIEGDQGMYFVKQIALGRNITAKELPIVEGWVKTLKKLQEDNSVEVDQSDNKQKPTSSKKSSRGASKKNVNKF